MQVIALRTLRQFWKEHPDAETPLRTWHARVTTAAWTGPAEVKKEFGTTIDFVGDSRVIFDIGGNKYRLIVHISYKYKRVLIKAILTHPEYNRIDPERVDVARTRRKAAEERS